MTWLSQAMPDMLDMAVVILHIGHIASDGAFRLQSS